MSDIKDKIGEVEKNLEELIKMDQTLKDHLSKIRQLAPDSARVIANKLFVDHMVPGVGNKAAYEDFLTRPRGGVHVILDGNSFGHLNKVQGQSAGDQAIKAMFGAAKRASRQFKGKLFRVGGDEGVLHFTTPEQAYGFARSLRHELSRLPPIGGTHALSMSVGIGQSPQHAEQALIHAKTAKKVSGRPPGQEDTHVHSLLPGSSGPVATPTPTPGFVDPTKAK